MIITFLRMFRMYFSHSFPTERVRSEIYQARARKHTRRVMAFEALLWLVCLAGLLLALCPVLQLLFDDLFC